MNRKGAMRASQILTCAAILSLSFSSITKGASADVNNIASILGAGFIVDATGNITATNIGQTGQNTVAGAITTLQTTTGTNTTNIANVYTQLGLTYGTTASPGVYTGTKYFRVNSVDTDSSVTGADSIAIGPSNKVTKKNAQAMGTKNEVASEGATSIGYSNQVYLNSDQSQAIGYHNQARGVGVVSIGSENNINTSAYSQGVGYKNFTIGSNTQIFGNNNFSNSDNTVLIGGNNMISYNTNYTYIVGQGITANQSNSIILGGFSTDRAATPMESVTINGLTYSAFAGQSNGSLTDVNLKVKGVVSVGSKEKERQIINVAAGAISSTSTDAINGSQLYATNLVLSNVATSVAKIFGSNATLGNNGTVTFTNIANTGKGTINDAIVAARTKVVGDNNMIAKESESNGAFTYTLGLQNVINIGVGGTSPKITIDGVNGHISGLTNKTWNGSDYVSGRAATEDQLRLLQATITNGSTQYVGDTGDLLSLPLGTTLSIQGGSTSTAMTVGNISVVGDKDKNLLRVELAKDLDLNQYDANHNIIATGSVTTGNTKIDTSGLTVGDSNNTAKTTVSAGNITLSGGTPLYDDKGALLTSSVILGNTGLSNGGYKITNVAAGVADTDAVNVSQLKTYASKAANTVSAANNNVIITTSTNASGSTNYTIGINNNLDLNTYDEKGILTTTGSLTTGNTLVNGTGLTISDKATGQSTAVRAGSIALSGGANEQAIVKLTSNGLDNGGYKLSNVATGTADTDAVNVGQLKTYVGAASTTISNANSNILVTPTPNDKGGTNYQIGINNNLNLNSYDTTGAITSTGSVTTGNTVLSTTGISVGDATSGQSTTVTAGSISLTGGSDAKAVVKLTNSGLDNGGYKAININDGDISATSKDAINGSQLFATNQQINNISNQYNRLDTKTNQIGAKSAALAALHPLDFDPDAKWDFAAGFGNYAGTNAAAMGVYYRPNAYTLFSIGTSFGDGDNMVNAGVSFKFGKNSGQSMSRLAMAQEIQELKAAVAQLQAQQKGSNATNTQSK